MQITSPSSKQPRSVHGMDRPEGLQLTTAMSPALGLNLSPHPRILLQGLAKLFPGAWKWFDLFRANRGKANHDWPSWCWCPMVHALAFASGGSHDFLAMGVQKAHQIAILGRALAALAAWRPGQGIYRFDSDLFEAIINTEMDKSVPWESLYRLPEWCVYIETPGMLYRGDPLSGFFAFLDYNPDGGRTELHLLLSCQNSLVPIPFNFVEGGSLKDGMEATYKEFRNRLTHAGFQEEEVDKAMLGLGRLLGDESTVMALVALVLYLCAENADFGGKQPIKVKAVKTGKGPRTMPPDRPRTWDVGSRVGVALRSLSNSEPRDHQGGSHASPRPHMRRAHWHHYWVGPRGNKGEHHLVVRWMPPVQVGAQVEGMPAVIHPVKPETAP